MAHLRFHCRRRRSRNLVYDSITRSKGRGRSQEKGGGSGSEFHLDKFYFKNVNSIWAWSARKREKNVNQFEHFWQENGKLGRFDEIERCVALRRRVEYTFFVEACRHESRKNGIFACKHLRQILFVAFSSSRRFSPSDGKASARVGSTCRMRLHTRVCTMWWLQNHWFFWRQTERWKTETCAIGSDSPIPCCAIWAIFLNRTKHAHVLVLL